MQREEVRKAEGSTWELSGHTWALLSMDSSAAKCGSCFQGEAAVCLQEALSPSSQTMLASLIDTHVGC